MGGPPGVCEVQAYDLFPFVDSEGFGSAAIPGDVNGAEVPAAVEKPMNASEIDGNPDDSTGLVDPEGIESRQWHRAL